MTKERLLPKGKMITNSKGVSYYQKGNKYYSNSGWLEREISYEIFEKEVIEDKGDEIIGIAFKCDSVIPLERKQK